MRLTTREAAEYLGLAPKTLEGWRIRGAGPRYVKLGDGRRSGVRYDRDELDRFLLERTRSSTSDPGQGATDAA